MAAGLPVVVSDWDGYHDTARDGIDGFRIPTLTPQAGLAGKLATRHALDLDSYDIYRGNNWMLVAVDIHATARALERLFISVDLRRRMGASGQRRARETYDWSVIIPQYESLWGELSAIRCGSGSGASRAVERAAISVGRSTAAAWPARMDPFHAFAAYPAHILTNRTMLSLAKPYSTDAGGDTGDWDKAARQLSADRAPAMIGFAKSNLPSAKEVKAVLRAAATCR